jgi:hypothetical protein
MTQMKDLPPRRIIILDSPRRCSHLFQRIFYDHPQLEHSSHLFAGPHSYGPQRIQLRLKRGPRADQGQRDWHAAMPHWATTTYEDTVTNLKRTIEAAEAKLSDGC